jgi:hypothetical protein
MKAAAVPREATSAQKSPWPVMTSSRTSTSFSTHLSAPVISSTEKLASSDAAPTELNMLSHRVVLQLAKLKHPSLRALNASLRFMFVTPSVRKETECEPCTLQDQQFTYTTVTKPGIITQCLNNNIKEGNSLITS